MITDQRAAQWRTAWVAGAALLVFVLTFGSLTELMSGVAVVLAGVVIVAAAAALVVPVVQPHHRPRIAQTTVHTTACQALRLPADPIRPRAPGRR